MKFYHSPSYAITIRLKYPDQPGKLGRITTTIGEADGFIGAVDIVSVRDGMITRDNTGDEGPDPKTRHPASTQEQRVFSVIRLSAYT